MRKKKAKKARKNQEEKNCSKSTATNECLCD
jgi:hypothetical protein